MTINPTRAAALLQLVHRHPGLTRAQAAARLGVGSGAVTELVGRLTTDRLLSQSAAAATGGRGRPTTALTPHPDGPLVLAVSITYDSWRLQVMELGAGVVLTLDGTHRGQPAAVVLSAIGTAGKQARQRFPGRIRATAVSIPGIVMDDRLLEAGHLGWGTTDLRGLAEPTEVFVAGNDATMAAVAESHRGAAIGAEVALHLRVDAGLGGAVIDHGRALDGATGVFGEFGHLPFGDPSRPCPCGAAGCWGASVDGAALAQLLRAPEPADSVAFFRATIDRARAGAEIELSALQVISTRLGRGTAGLANALDPAVITLGGLADPVLDLARGSFDRAYRAGLMAYRRASPPPVLTAALGEDGPLIGAAEQAWAALWAPLTDRP